MKLPYLISKMKKVINLNYHNHIWNLGGVQLNLFACRVRIGNCSQISNFSRRTNEMFILSAFITTFFWQENIFSFWREKLNRKTKNCQNKHIITMNSFWTRSKIRNEICDGKFCVWFSVKYVLMATIKLVHHVQQNHYQINKTESKLADVCRYLK